MVNREKLRGIFSALITPTNPDETVNYRALGEIVRRQLDDGVEGFYCCGSSGEGLLLTIEERKKILECVIESAEGGRRSSLISARSALLMYCPWPVMPNRPEPPPSP